MNQSSSTIERREVHFAGRVQGVGFRYTARAIAGRFPVKGFVKNLSDGRVLLVVESSPEVLDRFLDAVAKEMDRYIDNKTVAVRPATSEFTSFEIRH